MEKKILEEIKTFIMLQMKINSEMLEELKNIRRSLENGKY